VEDFSSALLVKDGFVGLFNVPHHQAYDAFETSASEGCSLCRPFVGKFDTLYAVQHEDEKILGLQWLLSDNTRFSFYCSKIGSRGQMPLGSLELFKRRGNNLK
jgi:hypothetical protein